MTPYLVSSFQQATFSALIRECFGYAFSDIFLKEQIKYLFGYLKECGCIYMLLEPEYIDREFLEDYSRYYVKRFGNDGYKCGRIHFFSCYIDHKSLDSLLQGSAVEEFTDGNLTIEYLQKHYLGFVVIKPLSRTFVGKTCLRLIGDSGTGDGTKKKITKCYKVNLFGVELHIESIAFQEQDKVVAACATTSIWTALHALPWRDVRLIPSCSEITINALNFAEGSNNGFPNKELTNKQIQRSLDVEGLRYHSTHLLTESRAWFQSCVTSYIDSDLPLILVGEVYSIHLPSEKEEEKSDEGCYPFKRRGGHAVTVLGYDFRDASNIIYIHDDRLGPYARVELVCLASHQAFKKVPELQKRWGLAFRCTNDGGRTWQSEYEILIPDACIVPTEKKARLPFQYAYGTAQAITQQIAADIVSLQALAVNVSDLPKGRVSFNIKLSSISKVREHVLQHKLARSVGEQILASDGRSLSYFNDESLERWREDRVRILTSPMARLQWEIDFICGDQEVFKVLLDATDIPLGNAVSGIYAKDPLHSELLFQMLRRIPNDDLNTDNTHFYGAFLNVLEQRDIDYENHLNQAYGALRAPLRLEESEISDSGKGLNKTIGHYFDPVEKKLTDIFPDIVSDPINRNLIWAIGRDGSLFVAEDLSEPKLGHPSMTGLQAARIAGEMWWTQENGMPIWHVNHASGRYSRDYVTPDKYLSNAVRKIASFFQDEIKFVAKGNSRPPNARIHSKNSVR